MGAGANAPHFLIHEAEIKLRKFDFFMPLETEELVFRFPQTHLSGVVTGKVEDVSFQDMLTFLVKRFNLT